MSHEVILCAITINGEPVFILRAQDKIAPSIIRDWARSASEAGTPKERTDDACTVADRFEQWQRDNPDRVKVPD